MLKKPILKRKKKHVYACNLLLSGNAGKPWECTGNIRITESCQPQSSMCENIDIPLLLWFPKFPQTIWFVLGC